MPAEPYLAKPSAVNRILDAYGLRTKKKYGQNFLIDPHVPEKILQAARVTEADCCLEIGPGIGTLTQYLAGRAGRVIAVEIDADLLPVLSETLSDWPNAVVVRADILKTDVRALLAEYGEGRPVRVIANLPYYITTPILMQLLESELPVGSYTLMVQKEVADRMQAGPGTKDYGALSLAVQYHTVPETVMTVPPSCFYPPPKVGSAVVHLQARQDRLTDEESGKRLFRIIRAAFLQRRKTLANALRNHAGYSREQTEAALAACGLRTDVRGEALSLEEICALEKALAAQEF